MMSPRPSLRLCVLIQTSVTLMWVSACGGGGGNPGPSPMSVVAAAPTISYPSSAYSFTVGVPTRPAGLGILPTVTGGTVTSWSVSPALPAGLTLGTSDGSISGTPTAAAAPAPYLVTAADSGGQSSTTLTITVAAGPLVDLGHAFPIHIIRLVNNVLLSQDEGSHWVLWNDSAGQQLASGSLCPYYFFMSNCWPLPVDLQGSTAVIQTYTGLEVRTATNNWQVSAEIVTTPSWWKLAPDGSYVCAGNATGLTAWSTTGSVLFTVQGNYSKAIAFAAPSQILVATQDPPAGTDAHELTVRYWDHQPRARA